jgi:hypothetical protein
VRRDPQPPVPGIHLPAKVKGEDDWRGEVRHEEHFGVGG